MNVLHNSDNVWRVSRHDSLSIQRRNKVKHRPMGLWVKMRLRFLESSNDERTKGLRRTNATLNERLEDHHCG